MAYTTPLVWGTGRVVTAADLNTYVSDNLTALKTPPGDVDTLDEASNYTTTSTSWAKVHATDRKLTITTAGGRVKVHFHGVIKNSGATEETFLGIIVDSTDPDDDGYVFHYGAVRACVTFTRWITGLDAGEHDFYLAWKVSGGTGELYCVDNHPQWWVEEN